MTVTADDEVIERLFALPPEEFIEARDNLAQQVRRDDPEAAAQIKALRKPTVAAWALNQVAHEYPEDVAKLLAAGDRLRTAQEKALSGGGGEALRAATLERRGLATRVGSMAAEALAESGRDETAHMAAISATLDAALRDATVAQALAQGRLVSEQEASGFGFGDDAPAVRPSAGRAGAGTVRPVPKPAKSAAVERAEHRADELTAKAVAARKEFNELSDAADLAEDAADEAEEAAREARKRAADLRRKATDARKAADRAENSVMTLEQKAWEAVDKARKG